jgi:ABC-2 type transport system ATP-binding protein
MTPTHAVTVRGLTKKYQGIQALNGVDLDIAQGEIFALLGPNGAGKTTTLEILEGFRTRDSGTVEVLGFDPSDRSTSLALRQRIGVVLQELAVEPFLNVRQALERSAGYYPHPRPVDEVLRLVGLEDRANVRIRKLSGGQQRRLDLGLGVIGDPELLFLDEPTTGFDPNARRAAWSLIRDLAHEGMTVLLTTHYMDEADALADRVAVIANGTIVAVDQTSRLGDRHRDEVLIRFELPPGFTEDQLPIQGFTRNGEHVEARSASAVSDLATLTSWAISQDIPLAGLEVLRRSLEDIYLELTRGSTTPGRSAERTS